MKPIWETIPQKAPIPWQGEEEGYGMGLLAGARGHLDSSSLLRASPAEVSGLAGYELPVGAGFGE